MTSEDTAANLRDQIYGFAISQAIYVATALGIPERLGTGEATCAELAEETGADLFALLQLLRLLAIAGIITEERPGRFALSESGKLLRRDAEGTMAPEVMHMLGASSWRTWGALEQSVRTGRPAFPSLFGEDAWTYRARHPEAGAAFDAMMTESTRREIPAVLDRIDLSRARCLVDVGGGEGAALAGALARNPGLHGILFDRRDVAGRWGAALESAGVAGRCRVVAGDFFGEVPSGGDVYLLRAVLHNWDDAASARILSNCRRAMASDARLFVVESAAGGSAGTMPPIWSLHMLVVHGGRARTLDEYRALIAGAGFVLVRHETTPVGLIILEAKPAPEGGTRASDG